MSSPQKNFGYSPKSVFRQTLMSLVAFAGVVCVGSVTAFPTVSIDQLQDEDETIHMTLTEVSWFASMPYLSSTLGAILVGTILDKIGRKRTMLLNNAIGFIGWAMLSAATESNLNLALTMMMVGRFISGIMVGLFISPAAVYTAEVTMPRVRGKLLLGTSMALSVGILFIYTLGFFLRNNWRLIAIICAIYQLLCFMLCFLIPESPSWLMQKGKEKKSKSSLKYFRGLRQRDGSQDEDFQAEFKLIKARSEKAALEQHDPFLTLVKQPEVYKPLLLIIGLFMFQQLSGVVALVSYTAQIAERAGVKMDPLLCSIGVGVIRIMTTFFLGFIVDSWGRRPVGITACLGMSCCLMLIAICNSDPSVSNTLPWLPVMAIFVQYIFSVMGLLTWPVFLLSEVFSQKVRGKSAGIAVCIGLCCSFLVLKTYPPLIASVGGVFVFSFYATSAFSAAWYIYFVLPETKDRALWEIEEYFKTGKFPDVKK